MRAEVDRIEMEVLGHISPWASNTTTETEVGDESDNVGETPPRFGSISPESQETIRQQEVIEILASATGLTDTIRNDELLVRHTPTETNPEEERRTDDVRSSNTNVEEQENPILNAVMAAEDYILMPDGTFATTMEQAVANDLTVEANIRNDIVESTEPTVYRPRPAHLVRRQDRNFVYYTFDSNASTPESQFE